MRTKLTLLTISVSVALFAQPKDEFVFEDSNENTVFTETLELEMEQAFVPAGFYFGWLLANGYQTDVVLEVADYTLDEFNAKESTGPELFMSDWEGRLTGELMNDDVFRFSKGYYGPGKYEEDLTALFELNTLSIYAIEDNWENFAKVRTMLDERFEAWRKQRLEQRK